MKTYPVKALFVSALTLVACLFTSGCDSDPIGHAQDYIASNDYKGALEALNQVESPAGNEAHIQQLKALALFVSGQSSAGWESLDIAYNLDKNRNETAKTLFQASEVIVREKNRIKEAIILMDSCLAYDENLKKEVIKLAWKRAVEYLEVPGPGGYYLIRFAQALDSEIRIRLRRHNRQLAVRYDEMDEVSMVLKDGVIEIEAFRQLHGRLPHDALELSSEIGLVAIREGWNFILKTDTEGGFQLVAEAKRRNPHDILAGTVLTAP